jgi:hypothetical protein
MLQDIMYELQFLLLVFNFAYEVSRCAIHSFQKLTAYIEVYIYIYLYRKAIQTYNKEIHNEDTTKQI